MRRYAIACFLLTLSSCTSPPKRGGGALVSVAPLQPIVALPATDASLAAAAPPASAEPAPRPHDHFTLDDELGRPIEVYPPISDAPKAPLVVVLHATCMEPASVCDWFGSAGRDSGWLVCPSGHSTCYGEPDWSGTGPDNTAFLGRAIEKVRDKVPSFVDDTNGVLIGWSRGAFAARDIIYTAAEDVDHDDARKRFRGLVLLAARFSPDVHLLKRAGIQRVVLAAGDYDGSASTMQMAASVLRVSGLEARYVSLGKIGHVWPQDFEARMREHIAWAAGTGT
jgi:predicted esterase